ncbi:MAG TPA: hypothetical protein VIC51_07445, partial [Psychromonas sp.]
MFKIIFTDFASLSIVNRGRVFTVVGHKFTALQVAMGRFALECFLMHDREQAGDNEDFDLPFNIYPFITV